jgi:hypothetical protein
MSQRRYDEDEVRQIFSLATTGGVRERPLPSESGGMTLDELQRIGQEAGIEPSRVAHAADALNARGKPAPVRRSFGMPVGVSRVVDLPRAPTDREWELLISEFRSTFGTQGTATTSGGFREWSVGKLSICVEPTERGHQLRLSTFKEDAVALNVLGIFLSAMSLIFSGAVIAAGKPGKAIPVFCMFGGMAVFAFATNVLRLPGWARERKQQMESLAEHAVKLLSNP